LVLPRCFVCRWCCRAASSAVGAAALLRLPLVLVQLMQLRVAPSVFAAAMCVCPSAGVLQGHCCRLTCHSFFLLLADACSHRFTDALALIDLAAAAFGAAADKEQRRRLGEEKAVLLAGRSAAYVCRRVQVERQSLPLALFCVAGRRVDISMVAVSWHLFSRRLLPRTLRGPPCRYLDGSNAHQALYDADACLHLCPNFGRGHSRKGDAHFELHAFDAALAACVFRSVASDTLRPTRTSAHPDSRPRNIPPFCALPKVPKRPRAAPQRRGGVGVPAQDRAR
jgi:hypothetical protein